MAAKGKKIFISYRREDAADVAGRIRDWLVQTRRITREDIFMDVSTILPGADFMKVITDTIRQCRAVIVVISPSWLKQVNSPDTSYVRAEAEIALDQLVTVIPVLVGGTKLPDDEQLPEKLRVLKRLNAQPLRHETFDYDMGRVSGALGLGGGIRIGWVAAIAALLVALSVGVLTQVPASNANPLWRALHSSNTVAPTATISPTPMPLTASQILARSRDALYKDMSGTISELTAGGTIRGTLVLTLNPARSEQVIGHYNLAGTIVSYEDLITAGSTSYTHTIDYKTTPPTDLGWSKGLTDPRPLTEQWLDEFTSSTTVIGTETVNGVSTYHLRAQLSDTLAADVWIRTDNFYLVQLTHTGGVLVGYLVSMTAWDTGLTITVPSV
jgi:hypothetical protein